MGVCNRRKIENESSKRGRTEGPMAFLWVLCIRKQNCEERQTEALYQVFKTPFGLSVQAKMGSSFITERRNICLLFRRIVFVVLSNFRESFPVLSFHMITHGRHMFGDDASVI